MLKKLWQFHCCHSFSDCRKSLFFQKSACSQSLTPNPFPVVKGCVCFVASASCRAFRHTRPASVPGLSVGLPPLVPVGGYAPKQGCFGCLPKVLHDAKPAEQATLDTPFSINKRFFDKLRAAVHKTVARKAVILFCCLHRSYIITVYCRTIYGKICSYTAGI